MSLIFSRGLILGEGFEERDRLISCGHFALVRGMCWLWFGRRRYALRVRSFADVEYDARDGRGRKGCMIRQRLMLKQGKSTRHYIRTRI